MDRVTEIAQEKGVKPSQLALAWVLAQNEHSVPIPGITRREHLQENIAALEVTLTSEDLARIEAVAPRARSSIQTQSPVLALIQAPSRMCTPPRHRGEIDGPALVI